MKLEELERGQVVSGIIPGTPVKLIDINWPGPNSIEVVYATDGLYNARILFREHEEDLRLAHANRRPFDAPASDFKLAAEAQRIKMAGIYDPMLAVSTSDVQPLPHQLTAVYQELLPRTPLRFLLADDPGAGKTIMAGLFIKELLLRDDVHRCLIVAPGGLVEQWQDELYFKFGLEFELLTNPMIQATVHGSVFDSHPLLIARMDQLSRNDELKDRLRTSEWDLVIVDEAHRMGAHYFGNEQRFTRRFELGQILGEVTRHLLLMTATPHSGKEDDFQLFLTLLDPDRFAGKATQKADTAGIMRRMVKEQLLTFEGKPLFPERIAETVPYELTPDEQELYEAVTHYVREGMNRAERLNDQRKNTVGFALTVLQRRVASSPEAIYQSLVRRSERLTKRRTDLVNGVLVDDSKLDTVDLEGLDDDDYTAEQTEQLENELIDQATAAATLEELDAELAELGMLIGKAAQVRASGTDKKWSELSRILQDETIARATDGRPRKLIVFTEHRDTLNYLQQRISSLLGRPEQVVAIHGGVSRVERRQITEEFTHNPDVQILLATDAAGEGLNLQVAHLMVNYDLPWNPNRIEQRFGRIHRIGQTEVCRLWNLVADNTREGEVFTALLGKLDQMRQTYGGRVFDVLGEAFAGTPLRTLLLNAIRYGDDPEVRARNNQVIKADVGDGLKELLDERALAANPLTDGLDELRRAMDEARARRLQPHYIQQAFTAAFTRLGGKLTRREHGRYEIRHVPASLRTNLDRPIASRYERVCFDLAHIQPDGLTRAELIAPGHALHDAVMDAITREFDNALEAGTVLISPAIDTPQLLVGLVEEITNAADPTPVARRFSYAWVDDQGQVADAGPAPYLDCTPAPTNHAAVEQARQLPWIAHAEKAASDWIITQRLPQYLGEVKPRITAEIDKTRTQVTNRLINERDRLVFDAIAAADKERAGEPVKLSSEHLNRKAEELEARRIARMALLDKQAALSIRPPRIITTALVLPGSMFTDDELPPHFARETKEVERRGVELALASERALGRIPEEQPFNNPGFDIRSIDPTTGQSLCIEVKARIKGADTFNISHTEVLTAKNMQPDYRLAMIEVSPDGPERDRIVYVDDPFATTILGDLQTEYIALKWLPMWDRGNPPH
ncbi:helicase-related protein [Luteococcus sp. H138]|uniref:helicase-related protein n=1 Tax=unclassified Luteococcus TaxID=2639923 RepID=UPI00313B46B9